MNDCCLKARKWCPGCGHFYCAVCGGEADTASDVPVTLSEAICEHPRPDRGERASDLGHPC